MLGRQVHPFTHERLHPGRDREEVTDHCREPFGISALRRETARVEQLGNVGEGVARSDRLHAETRQRPYVKLEPVARAKAPSDRGSTAGPRPVEEQKYAVVKDVEEPAHRRIIGVPLAFAGVLRQV